MSLKSRVTQAELDIVTANENIGTANNNITQLNNNLQGISNLVSGLTPPTVLTLGSNIATSNNVTPVTVIGLIFNYVANSKYKIELFALVQPAAGTTGCGFQFDLSSAVTRIGFRFTHQLANTGTLSGGHSIADNVSVGVSSGMPGTSTYPVNGSGILITGANAGTAQLMFRSETTAITTLLANTVLIITKIQ